MIGLVTENDILKSETWADKVYVSGKYPGVFCPEHFRRTWKRLIDSGMAVLMKRESGGLIHEAIGMILYKDPNTGDLSAGCAIWIVLRKPVGLEGGMLFLEMLNELKRRGISQVCMSVGLNGRFAQTRHMLESFGFKPVEVNFYKKL